MYPEELLAHVLRATRERLEQQGLDVAGGAVEDIVVGTVLTELGGAKSGRLASLHVGEERMLPRNGLANTEQLPDVHRLQGGQPAVCFVSSVRHGRRFEHPMRHDRYGNRCWGRVDDAGLRGTSNVDFERIAYDLTPDESYSGRPLAVHGQQPRRSGKGLSDADGADQRSRC